MVRTVIPVQQPTPEATPAVGQPPAAGSAGQPAPAEAPAPSPSPVPAAPQPPAAASTPLPTAAEPAPAAQPTPAVATQVPAARPAATPLQAVEVYPRSGAEGAVADSGDATAPVSGSETALGSLRDLHDVPAAATVISGDELRLRGARSLTEALSDVPGLFLADGSDEGAWFPEIGLRGLQENEALLVTVDGVPAGGPFDPTLAQIPLDDVEKIEIVRAPQPALYGMLAYTGAIHVTTRMREAGWIRARAGGGSYGEIEGSAAWTPDFGDATQFRVSASGLRDDGWLERSRRSLGRITVGLQHSFGQGGRVKLFAQSYWDTQDWNSPIPYVEGAPLEGFDPDVNYAVGGAVRKHRDLDFHVHVSYPLTKSLRLENTLGAGWDDQNMVRSYVFRVVRGQATSGGISASPLEKAFYDDLRLASDFSLFGRHRLIAGASVSTGTFGGDGRPYTFRFELTPDPAIPNLRDLERGDAVSYENRRTLAGFYVHDEWTPVRWLTLSGGGRYNLSYDKLVKGIEGGSSVKGDYKGFTGEGSLLVRLADDRKGSLSDASFYGSARHNFKAPAPEFEALAEAQLFEPEWIDSFEAGFKTSWLERRLAADLAFFYTELENRVIPTAAGSRIVLLNAGEERVTGGELALAWTPTFVEHLTARAAYTYQKSEFRTATYVSGEGTLVDVEGESLPFVPKSVWNLSVQYAPEHGFGGFASVRGQDKRPLDAPNVFYADAYTEFDLGLWYSLRWARVAVHGRNVGDEVHVSTGSEAAQGQVYQAQPLRVSGELTVWF